MTSLLNRLTRTTEWRLLRDQATFRRVWYGALVSAFGDSLAWLALSWLVLELTNDGTAVGIVLLCTALPALVTGPIIGRLLDHYQPRTLMIIDNVARAAIIGLIPLLHTLGLLQVWMVYALAIFSGALAPASQVGLRVLVPQLLPDDQLEAGNVFLSLTWQLPTVLGPVIAGLLIAAWGAASALLVDALTFLVMAWALQILPDFVRRSAGIRSHKIGLSLLRQFPLLAMIIALSATFFLAYGPLEAALPIFAKHTLNVNADAYGLLWSGCGVGIVLGGVNASWLARRVRIGLLLCCTMLLWGLCQALIGLSTTYFMALIALTVGGMIWGPYLSLEATLIQRNVPTELHGQVFGLRSALTAPMAPLGTAVGGVLLRFWLPYEVIVGSALVCVVMGGLALLWPRLRRA